MLHQTISLGRVAGIRIGAHWSVLVTIALFTWILGTNLRGTDGAAFVWIVAAGGAVALFACLAAHELAHSIVARRNGVRVDRIVLWLLGGVSELTDEPRTARIDLRIALAGPVASLALAAVATGAAAAVGTIAHEDDLLADAATRVVLRPKLDAIAVVDRVGRLTGMITATDLVTACDRSALRLPLRNTIPGRLV